MSQIYKHWSTFDIVHLGAFFSCREKEMQLESLYPYLQIKVPIVIVKSLFLSCSGFYLAG